MIAYINLDSTDIHLFKIRYMPRSSDLSLCLICARKQVFQRHGSAQRAHLDFWLEHTFTFKHSSCR
jgi:hypothetical protein